jgi:hypothetical protein
LDPFESIGNSIVDWRSMPFISLTRLRLRSWTIVPAFFLAAIPINVRARKSPGNLGVRVLSDRKWTFWTCTCWESEAAMRAFMHAKPHGPAMRKLLEWCDEAAVAHWTQESTELPTWVEAHRRMQAEGRASKVNHPSEAHKAFRIDPPRG